MPLFSSILRTPALRAFVLQAFAFFLALLTVAIAELVVGRDLPLFVWAALQGLIAAGLSRRAGLASWWSVIQFLFPLALVAMLAIRLPPTVFLGVFLVFVVLYWTTFRTQVPFYPSTPSTWEVVARLLPQDAPIRFVDIGSGFGGLVLHLAKRYPESRFAGVELAPLPWLVSHLRARAACSQTRFLRRDYADLDFSDYDVVFAFLSPAAMPALWQKARAEMHKGALLLSYEFPIPDVRPDIELPADNRGAALYGWRM